MEYIWRGGCVGEVCLRHLLSTVPSKPTLPVAPEAGSSIKHIMGIDPTCASLNAEGSLQSKGRVLCPDTSSQPKLGVVGQCYSLLGSAEGQHGQHRTKYLYSKAQQLCTYIHTFNHRADLLLHTDRHWLHFSNECGWIETSFACWDSSTRLIDLCTLQLSLLDITIYCVPLRGCYYGTHINTLQERG